LKFPVPKVANKVSIIIPTRDKSDLLSTCVYSILQNTSFNNYEIIIVDNGSVDEKTFALFQRLQTYGVKVMKHDAIFNFSELVNLGAGAATGDYLCLLNNDIEVVSCDWLQELLSHASLHSVGAVGARLWYPNLTLQHGGVILGLGGLACHAHLGLAYGDQGFQGRAVLQQSLSAVTAACLMVDRDKFEEVGGFNTKLAVAFNDVDFCLRLLEAGYENLWTPYAELIHHESASRGTDETPTKSARLRAEKFYMWDRWQAIIDSDPAYNPNLTVEGEDFSLAWPPRRT
jgi:GT2 family glycosyltransferase